MTNQYIVQAIFSGFYPTELFTSALLNEYLIIESIHERLYLCQKIQKSAAFLIDLKSHKYKVKACHLNALHFTSTSPFSPFFSSGLITGIAWAEDQHQSPLLILSNLIMEGGVWSWVDSSFIIKILFFIGLGQTTNWYMKLSPSQSMSLLGLVHHCWV